MQLGEALKKTAKKRAKVKTTRTKATVAQADRPYTNDISRKTKSSKRSERPSAIVVDLVRSFAEQSYKQARKQLSQYETRIEKRVSGLLGLVKKKIGK